MSYRGNHKNEEKYKEKFKGQPTSNQTDSYSVQGLKKAFANEARNVHFRFLRAAALVANKAAPRLQTKWEYYMLLKFSFQFGRISNAFKRKISIALGNIRSKRN
jgi:hypothetical protein